MHQRVFSTHTADRQRRLQDAGTSLVSAGRALAVSGFMLAAFAPSAFAQAEATMQSPSSDGVDKLLVVWFVLTGLTMAYLAWDLFTRTPAMKVMKWGWLLVAVYTGPVAFIVYWFSCREPEPGTHEKFVSPQWKQTVGSTIHCMAGDATGVIIAAALTSLLHTPMWLDSLVEYLAGFFFGLFIFQALFMKDMLGGSYWGAVRATVLPEWLSMNGVMAGMIPTMVILMSHDMAAMHPTSIRFWGIMSLATLVGAIPAYPINWWLVSKGLKHGMGTERVLGRGGAPVPEPEGAERDMVHAGHAQHKASVDQMPMGHRMGTSPGNTGMGPTHGSGRGSEHQPPVPASSKVIVSILSLLVLAIGILIAAVYGDFSMSAGTMDSEASKERPMVGMEADMRTRAATNSSHH
ncbi:MULTISPECIES: DUF4396 domain-containing protein [Massilia]|uniref:DUF4396 domain-containing protein n=1 Tax=Massilia TaxID=149698 RepID=UPI0009515578|nr:MULTISPECIES: DUF4396 domain-containing protein [Massilia]